MLQPFNSKTVTVSLLANVIPSFDSNNPFILLINLIAISWVVISLCEPSEELPQSEPYAFWVDSPFALGQDKNDNLHNEWPVAVNETE